MALLNKMLSLLMAALMLLPVFGKEPVSATEAEKAELIRNIVLDYGYYPDESEEQIKKLLDELKDIDPELGEQWEDIIEVWKLTREGLRVNTDAIPEGLYKDKRLCIVVLGFSLKPDGSMRDELVSRLETALAFAGAYPEAYVLCTGGGTATFNPFVTEAGQMAKWLEQNGLDPNRIIIEKESQTTGQNAMFSCALLHSSYPDVKQLAIVSSDYHIPWGTMLFQAQLILTEGSERSVLVVSNAACVTDQQANYPFKYQAAGLLELAGQTQLAMDIYNERNAVPTLK